MSVSERLCRCGLPEKHYDTLSPGDPAVILAEELVEKLIREQGENILVTVAGRAWRVPRRFIALHGLKAWELPGLGFEEVPHQ